MLSLRWSINFVTASDPLVTRLGEILPLWQNISSLWLFLEGLFNIWKHCEPTLVNFLVCLANIQCCKGQKIERII